MMDELTVTRSEPSEAVSYMVYCVVKGEGARDMIVADHVETGTHWVKLFHGGKLTGLFSAGTVISVLPVEPLGAEAKAALVDPTGSSDC